MGVTQRIVMIIKLFKLYLVCGCLASLLIVLSVGSAFAQYPGFSDPDARRAPGSGSSGLVPVENSVDGGMVPMGATAQVVVRFRNDGAVPVQTGLIRLYPSSTVSATVSLNQCKDGALPPEAECAIALSVKGLQSGSWRVEMLMSHSGRSRLVTSTVSGQVETGGDSADSLSSDIETIPAEIDFGTLSDSQTLVEPIILRNTTSVPLELSDIYIDAGDQAGYQLKTECEKLEAGQACIAIVSWSPKLKGRSSGVLVIKHSGPAALSSVPLEGEYSPGIVSEADIFPSAIPGRGLLVSSQEEIDFGTGIGIASTITVSLVNAGDSDLTLNAIEIAGSDNGLNFKEGGCDTGMVLGPVEACPLTITWSPTRIGALFDDVKIMHDGARGVLVLPIRGAASSTVSQDQKAIVVSGSDGESGSGEALSGLTSEQEARWAKIEAAIASAASGDSTQLKTLSLDTQGMTNISSVLGGYKITSFSPSRAIISGPGGSRIVFNGEDSVIGGVPWYVIIQKNGIEFLHQDEKVLLLFDRSLSAISGASTSASTSSSSSTSLSTTNSTSTGG